MPPEHFHSGLVQAGYVFIIGPAAFLQKVVGQQFDIIWRRIEKFWNETQDKVEIVLREHEHELDMLAKSLLEHESLTGREVCQLIEEAAQARANQAGDIQLEPAINPLDIVDEIVAESERITRSKFAVSDDVPLPGAD